MCEWGTLEYIELTIPAHLSYTGEARKKSVGIDSCIAPLVRALNDGGITTVASCCGHGRRPGDIILSDGRELIIAPDFETARKINAAFPPIFDEVRPVPSSREMCNRWAREIVRLAHLALWVAVGLALAAVGVVAIVTELVTK